MIVDEIKMALDGREPLAAIPARVEARQAERARFTVELSRRATDTMLAGADPIEGTRWKTEPAFQRDLMRLYRDVSMPRRGAPYNPIRRFA